MRLTFSRRFKKGLARLSISELVVISLALEGSLASIFCLWLFLSRPTVRIWPAADELVLGLLYCGPLFVLNFILFGPLSERFSVLRSCIRFREKVVRPLASQLNLRSALIVSISAGIGEELFFRGLLLQETGIVVSSLLFSLMHFGPAVRDFPLVAGIYVVIGVYFAALAQAYQGLGVPIITHTAYDYVALLYLRYFTVPNRRFVGEDPVAVRSL